MSLTFLKNINIRRKWEVLILIFLPCWIFLARSLTLIVYPFSLNAVRKRPDLLVLYVEETSKLFLCQYYNISTVVLTVQVALNAKMTYFSKFLPVPRKLRAISSWVENTPKKSYYMLAVNGHTLYRINYPIKLHKWYHSCQSWNGKTGEWQLWINGERVSRGYYNLVSAQSLTSWYTSYQHWINTIYEPRW